MTKRRRTRSLKRSLLQLDNYWLESISLRVNQHRGDASVTNGEIPLRYYAERAEQSTDEPKQHLVRITVRTPRSTRYEQPFDVELTLLGQFSFSEPLDDDSANALLRFNAPAILFGVARGMVSLLTSLTEVGRWNLPTVNLTA